MIRKFCLMIAMIFSMFSQAECEESKWSQAPIDAMYADLGNYIQYDRGSAGTGLRISNYINRVSIDVQKYDPPQYIIAFHRIEQLVGHHMNTVSESGHDSIVRYSYDLDLKKMYIERCENGTCHWEYLEPSKIDRLMGTDRDIAGGEMAFYLAYNQSFYDEPKTFYVKKFINEGLSEISLIRFENEFSDHCYYNHVTHELEWWKYVDGKSVRVK